MSFSDLWGNKKVWQAALSEGGLRLWQRADQIFQIDLDQLDKLCALLRKPPVLPVNTLSSSAQRERIYVVRVQDHVEIRRLGASGSMSLSEAESLADRVSALKPDAGQSRVASSGNAKPAASTLSSCPASRSSAARGPRTSVH